MPLPLSNLYVHRDRHRWWLYHPLCPRPSHLKTEEDVQQTTRRLGPRSVCEESRSATPTSPWRPPVHWSRKCHHTSPHCWWPPATSPPPLGESCTHRPCHPHPSCPLLKGPDDPDWCIPLKYIWTWCYSSIKRRKLPSPLPLSTQTKRQPKCKEIENLLQMHILAKCSANINNATVLRVAVRGSKRALGTKPTPPHFTTHHWL